MLASILLDATTTTTTNGGGGMSMIFMIVAMIAIFYFFMIRPQNKKQKEIREFRNSLVKGDKVVTAGGIHGRVRDIKENTILLEIAENVKITIDKSSVYQSQQDAIESGNDVKSK